MDPKEKLLDEIADAYAEIDDLVEEHEEIFQQRFALLLDEIGERAPKIWGDFPIDIALCDLFRLAEFRLDIAMRLVKCAKDQTVSEIRSIPHLKTA